MGQVSKNGRFKQRYYTPDQLTSIELERYIKFKIPLDEDQLAIVSNWCQKNIKNYALVDEDYIFFTHNYEKEKFVSYWSEIYSTHVEIVAEELNAA